MTLSLTAQRYFAAAPDEQLGDKLWARFEQSHQEYTPRAARWFAAYSHYYGDETEAGRTWGMARRGEAGELAAIRINRARRGSKARQQLILSGRVAFKTKARTQDSDAQLAQLISQTWLEYDFTQNGMEQLWRQGSEYSEVFAEAYAFTEFDRTRGSSTMTPHGVMRDGDVRTTLLPPWLVSTDNSVASPKDRNWWFVCTSRPKVDLSMLYLKVRRGKQWVTGEEAERAIYDAKPFMTNNALAWYGQRADLDRSLEDNAEVVCFIHYPTLRFPLGRFVRMLSGDCILEDRPLIGEAGDYDETALPLQRLSADEMAGTPHAWTTFYDVLANQELLDGLDTGAATIASSFSTPIYAIEKGSSNKPDKLVLGMRPWEILPGQKPPQLIERPEVPESLLRYREELQADMDKSFAVNDDATGATDSKDKNAQAEALRASMSIQQVSAQSAETRSWLRRVMECRLKTLRKNMRGERLLKACGESQRHLLEGSRFFKAQELEPLDSVELEESNPMEDTPQGRQAMLDFYGQHGLVRTQEDVEAVQRTGKLPKVVNPIRDENILIEQENEMLQRGEMPHVYPAQNDVLHMRQHACVTLDFVTLNRRPEVLAAHSQHDQAHWLQRFGCDRDTDPLFRARMEFIAGRGPEPVAPIPPPALVGGTMPPAPGQPTPTPGPQPGAGAATPPPQPGQGTATPSPQPKNGEGAVHLPQNPLTKQPFSPNVPPIQGPPQ